MGRLYGIIHLMMTIDIRPLDAGDYPLLLTWLQQPHVREWWDDGDDTIEKVAASFGDDDGCERYLIMADERAVGYIQSYWVEGNSAGLDLFIGEPDAVGRGLGPQVIRAFIARELAPRNPARIIIDPDPANRRAIRCYTKAGFRHYATVLNDEGKPAYMMELVEGQASEEGQG